MSDPTPESSGPSSSGGGDESALQAPAASPSVQRGGRGGHDGFRGRGGRGPFRGGNRGGGRGGFMPRNQDGGNFERGKSVVFCICHFLH